MEEWLWCMFNKTPKRSKSVRGSGALPAAAAELVLQWDRGCWWVQSPRRVTPLGPFIMSKTRKVANPLAHHQPAATRPWAGPGGVTRLGLCAHQRPRPSYSTTSAKRCGQFVIFSGFLHDEPGATRRWAEPGGVIHLRLCADHRPRLSYSTTLAKRRIGRLLGCRHGASRTRLTWIFEHFWTRRTHRATLTWTGPSNVIRLGPCHQHPRPPCSTTSAKSTVGRLLGRRYGASPTRCTWSCCSFAFWTRQTEVNPPLGI